MDDSTLSMKLSVDALRRAESYGKSRVDAVIAFLSPQREWIKEGRHINTKALNWNARHYIGRAGVTESEDLLQRLTLSALRLASEPEILLPQMREWVAKRSDMPERERDYVIALLQRFERAMAGLTVSNAGQQPTEVERDERLGIAVEVVCSAFSLSPARNRASGDKGGADSGCNLVSEALAKLGVKLSPSRLETIHRRWKTIHSKHRPQRIK
jgi:hypothetical protein